METLFEIISSEVWAIRVHWLANSGTRPAARGSRLVFMNLIDLVNIISVLNWEGRDRLGALYPRRAPSGDGGMPG